MSWSAASEFSAPGWRFGVDQMGPHMVLDHLGHQAAGRAAHGGDQVHHRLAAGLLVERPLDRLDLAPDSAHAREELLLVADGVSHAR